MLQNLAVELKKASRVVPYEVLSPDRLVKTDAEAGYVSTPSSQYFWKQHADDKGTTENSRLMVVLSCLEPGERIIVEYNIVITLY